MANYYEAFDDGMAAGRCRGRREGEAAGYKKGYEKGYAEGYAEGQAHPIVPPDGSEEHPYPVASLADLEQLRQDVADGDCKKDVHFLQTADIDMSGTPWSGIGLMSPDTPKYDPDPDHMFKGTYDGGGHVIDHLVLHCESTDTGKANRYKALFRTAGYGATIKNLTVNVDGVDHWEQEDIMAAAFVGCAEGPLTIENCTANGTLGTASQPLDNSAGILCRIAVDHNSSPSTTLTNVTNNVDIVGICKIGGIVSYAYGTLNFNNVVNNGDLTRIGLDATRDDAVGGLVGYGHQGNAHVTYKFNGVKNTGTITADLTTYARSVGQLVGKWSLMTGSTSSGDIAVLNSNDVPLAKSCPTVGSNPSIISDALPIFFGEIGEDGYLHCVGALADGKEYVYLVNNVKQDGTAGTPPAYALPAGATVVVDQRFGSTPNITGAGEPVDLGDNRFRYTAEAAVA